MSGQEWVVGLLVLTATAYLVWQTRRTWFGAKGGCGGGCACPGKKVASKADGTATTLISVNELTQRLRERS